MWLWRCGVYISTYILIVCSLVGVVLMISGENMNWRDYGIISVCVVVCGLTAAWSIHAAVSKGEWGR